MGASFDPLDVAHDALVLVHTPKTGGTLFAAQLLRLVLNETDRCLCDRGAESGHGYVQQEHNTLLAQRRFGQHVRDASCHCDWLAAPPTIGAAFSFHPFFYT